MNAAASDGFGVLARARCRTAHPSEMTLGERAPRPGFQVTLESNCTLCVGEFHNDRDVPWSAARRMDRPPALCTASRAGTSEVIPV